jgi:hypothetical protein
MTKTEILLAIFSLALVCSTALLSHSYALKFVSSPQTRAASKHSSTWSPPYLTKEEREEYRIYLMEQENETKYMLWNEWKLSKVFKKTLTQLDKKNGR